jgi:hypothetical protein
MRFFNGVKQDVLLEICGQNNVTYLGYPSCIGVDAYCTPSTYIDHPDGIHTNIRYAELVFDQLKRSIF